MSLSKEAYQELQSIVGVEWVSDDPAICEADRAKGAPSKPVVRPACVIQPETTEEVQAIVKLCNRYMIPFAATSTFGSDPPGYERENALFVDLKRMRKLEVDEDNLYATVEPGVSAAALQAELFQRSLMTFVAMSGGQCSVLANNLFGGEGALSYRLGDRGYRRILAVEWVTPSGELLRSGSRSTSKSYFWGEGPGPDLRGLVTAGGGFGSPASKGVVTKIGIRIFPFIKERLEPAGDSPSTVLNLPENRFMWYNFTFPTRKAAVDAIYEIAKCEIGLLLMTVPLWFFSMAAARSTGGAAGFWDNWNNKTGPQARENPEQTVGRILLYGIGSEKRLFYEEKVLLDICAEFGATARKSRGLRDQTHFMSADAIVSNLSGGRFTSVILFESVDHALKAADIVNRNTKKHVPPIFEDYGTTNWFLPYDMAHTGKGESLRFTTVESENELALLMQDCHRDFVELGVYPMNPDPEIYGPRWGNYPEKEKKIKQLLDPNNLAPA
ncbi:FAD-binding oxidoreductase [Chloroflexota bacterium]